MVLKNKESFFGTQMQRNSRKRHNSKIPWMLTRLQKIVLLYPTYEASEIEFKALTVLKSVILK